MRADMHEVVIERPRNGMRGPRRNKTWNVGVHDHEAIPQRESTSRHRGGTKHLTDLLGPLKRFLDGAVGRPWDDVYSELRSGLSPRSLLHNHILEHVRSMVGLDGYRWGRFEICPRTGVLKRRVGSWRALRDPERGDHVSPRTFLLRRVGRPWVDVAAALVRAGASEREAATARRADGATHRKNQCEIAYQSISHAWCTAVSGSRLERTWNYSVSERP